jgi:plastocyanin
MKKLLLLPVLVLGLAAAAPAGADDYQATISPSGFPPLISIQNGDRVVWKNSDTVNRQLVADDGSWKSPVIAPGNTWSHVFLNGGTLSYHGVFKPGQHGTVTVSSTRVVLMRQSAKTVQIFRTVRLQGSISKPGANGEIVSIEARPFGDSIFHEVARTTTQNGVWHVQVKPRRITVYRAVWQNVPSGEHIVNVKPFVRLKQVGRRLFSVRVSADTTLVRRWVVIQRFNKRLHTWRSFKALRLTRFRAKTGSYTSIGNFRATFPHGMIIRAIITKHQTLPLMYGPAWSRALRV